MGEELQMFPHGLMFHHFHDHQHPKGQGAIDADQFDSIISRYNGRILSANEWMDRARRDKLPDDAICLTFDDALRCQIDVALPVLRAHNLTAFWFVYSSVFEGTPDPLELYRYFRTVTFDSFDHFCDEFIKTGTAHFEQKIATGLNGVDVTSYLQAFPFYSYNDRLFRYLRDQVLTTEDYATIMHAMMATRNFDINKARESLWMTDVHLTSLADNDHCVGLHSYTHPLRIERLHIDGQRDEYLKNFAHISMTTGSHPVSVSHPCNSYNADTLRVLKEIGVEIGFRAEMSKGRAETLLEFPREDHTNIIAAMQ